MAIFIGGVMHFEMNDATLSELCTTLDNLDKLSGEDDGPGCCPTSVEWTKESGLLTVNWGD